MNPKRDSQSNRNEDELYASVPIGAARLEGKLEQFGELNVRMTMVGRWEAAKPEIRKSELQGADCERATHVITGMTVGAFSFYAGAATESAGGAHVAGVGVGATSARGREELSQDGDPARCAVASVRRSRWTTAAKSSGWRLPSSAPRRPCALKVPSSATDSAFAGRWSPLLLSLPRNPEVAPGGRAAAPDAT